MSTTPTGHTKNRSDISEIARLQTQLWAPPTGGAAADESPLLCAWRGSLPWHALGQAIVRELLARSGLEPGRAARLAWQHDPASGAPIAGCRNRRDLIERKTLVELVSAGLAHTDMWTYRLTANQARVALKRLIQILQQQRGYELAVASRSIPAALLMQPAANLAIIGGHEGANAAGQASISRSPQMLAAVRSHFDSVWNDPGTLRDRAQVIALLQESIDRLTKRVIL